MAGPLRNFLMAVLVLLAALSTAQAATFEHGALEIETGDGARHAFAVELATAPDQWMQGLMFRQTLPADAGMLFIYKQERLQTMWMKNTFIPLDMVFIDKHGVIVDIAQRTVPHSTQIISPAAPALAVLELNGGTTARLGIRRGDRVIHSAFATP
jgi:uncharacterized membrane protein (UPF0127 family)